MVVAAPLALESVTLIVKVLIPVVTGVPEMTPVAALRLRPVGSEPVLTEKVYGCTPPLTAMVWL